MYEKGNGVGADFDRAKLWYRKSAAQGKKAAKKRLASISDGGFKVCNKSGQSVSVAYATFTGRKNSAGKSLYESQGWRNIDIGKFSILWSPPLNKGDYYVFGQASDGKWDGDYPFCILDGKFRLVETQCGEGYKRKFLDKIEVKTGTIKYTYNLNP